MDDLEAKHYRKFRTGFTYKEVSDMLWSYDEDPATWHVSNANGYLVKGKRPNTKKKRARGGTPSLASGVKSSLICGQESLTSAAGLSGILNGKTRLQIFFSAMIYEGTHELKRIIPAGN